MASTIPISAPDLKEMSSFAVAIALWNHLSSPSGMLTTNGYGKDCQEWNLCRSKIQLLTPHLSVPKSIEEYIGKYIDKISNEIRSWVSYHLRSIFFDNGNDYHMYYHVRHLIWYPGGTINYRQTARNLLKSHRLSDIEKYRFLCTYCLEEEMRQLPSALFSTGVLDKISSFTNYPLIFYWNCYFRNELDKIRAFNINENEVSLNQFMLNQRFVDNWPSKEYFFDRLSPEEQTQSAISIINLHGSKYQKLILIKLNDSQRLHVYLNIGVDIILNYAKARRAEDLLETWFEVHNLITESQFATLFSELVKARVADTILSDVWIHCNDDFKRFVIESNNYKIIESVFQLFESSISIDREFVFVFTMLSDMNDSVKETITNAPFFTCCCNKLLSYKKYSTFDRLLKSSFSDTKKLIKFKRNIVTRNGTVTSSCLTYYDTGDLDGLNAFLTPLLSDPDSKDNFLFEFKKTILMSPSGISKCVHHMNSIKEQTTLKNIINDGLPTEALAAEFKKKLIFSSESVQNLRRMIEVKKVNKLEKLISKFLSSPEDKKALKKRLLDDAVGLVSKMFLKHDDDSRWQSFMQWCLEDDVAIQEFKSKLRVDEIFDVLLKNCVFRIYDYRDRVSFCSFHKEVKFDAVDRFLKWYFISASKIKEYKVQRIYCWMNIRTINTLLKKRSNQYLTTVMKWFFLKNNKQMVKFKSKFSGQRVALVL